MAQKGNHKVGIIVPYRNRYGQLLQLKSSIRKHLQSQKIEFELIVVEQDGAKTFNRGKLLNIGYITAKKLKCDYIVFHDVDMIPFKVDYSYSEFPVHLATDFSAKGSNRMVFDEYFGGVTLFPIEIFEEINGYSNEYWGWGYEDDDLLFRCKIFGVDLAKKEVKMMGGNTAALKLNGINSYVKSKNVVDLSEPITFFVSFYPDEIMCDHLQYDDTYPVLSIPGYGLLITHNSYKRYNFEVFDVNKNVIYINSDIKTEYQTNICVTIDPRRKSIKMYQDGNLVLVKSYENELINDKDIKFMYMGVNDPKNETYIKYYRGLINNLAVYSKCLTEDEIKEISNNRYFGLSYNFGKYNSDYALKLYYDAKFIKNYKLMDLSGNGNDGEIVNSEIVGYAFEETKTLLIPHRRDGTFVLLPHEENGYVGNGWKDITTRYNQLKYHNEVCKGSRNTKKDGISNCEFRTLSESKIDNETHILVSI